MCPFVSSLVKHDKDLNTSSNHLTCHTECSISYLHYSHHQMQHFHKTKNHCNLENHLALIFQDPNVWPTLELLMNLMNDSYY